MAGKAEFLAYFGISGFCLGLDYSLFLLLESLKVATVLAGSLSYVAGLLFHFLLSREILFTEMAQDRPIGISLAEYGLTGAFGTAVTAATLWLALQWTFSGPQAKALACATAFLSVYALRKRMFFTPQPAAYGKASTIAIVLKDTSRKRPAKKAPQAILKLLRASSAMTPKARKTAKAGSEGSR